MKLKLKTKRLLLEPMMDDQMQALIDNETDAHMKAAYAEMLAACREKPAARQWCAAWSICQKDGTMVGDLCFKGAPVYGEVEVGYGIAEAFQGQGYATEAVNAAVDWAFTQPDVYYVTAETEPGNATSQRVLQKAGFVQNGEGAEGPRFEKEKPETHWMLIYLALGMSVGAAFSASSGGVGLGISIGMCIGLALGVALDAQEKKEREKRRAQRNKAMEERKG